MNWFLELIPRFVTETCAFVKIYKEDLGDGADLVEMELVACVDDLSEDDYFDATMDVSSMAWFGFRFFITYKVATYKEYTKEIKE